MKQATTVKNSYPSILDGKNKLDKKIYIDKEALRQIKWYVNHCSFEISGLGKVVTDEDGNYIVNSIYLLQQEGSAAETELDDNAVAKLLFESKDDPGSMFFWWHSHVDMEVFWSGTDKDTIYQLGKSGMVISSVFNKKGEIRTSVYYKGQGMQPDSFYDELPLYVSEDVDEEFEERMLAEYKAKVTEDVGNYGFGNGKLGYAGNAWNDEDTDWDMWYYFEGGKYDTKAIIEFLNAEGYHTLGLTVKDLDEFLNLGVEKRKKAIEDFSATVHYGMPSYVGGMTVFDFAEVVLHRKEEMKSKYQDKGYKGGKK